MKLALIGHGKMGQMIEKIAVHQGHEIVCKYYDVRPLRATDSAREELKDVAVLLDFSSGDAVLDNIRAAVAFSIPLVEGTTGWQPHINEAERIVCEGGIGMIYASNFSLGVNLFYKILEQAGRAMSPFGQYAPFIEEAHHQFKKDAPSGTAIEMEKILKKDYASIPIPIASLRAGFIPGRHVAGFDSTVDTIRLEHSARNREGLAEGALLAARWIVNRKGFHHFRDVLDQLDLENQK
jgi:4-hydroxy-tetrahydrodipicolinate reductase